MILLKKTKRKICQLSAFALVSCFLSGVQTYGQSTDSGVRTVHLTQDDGQIRYETKVFELKNTSADDVLPFVRTAVLRYSTNSNAQKVTGDNGNHTIIVSTGKKFMPYVEEIVNALDHGETITPDGKVINGTGVERVAYEPKYRAAAQFSELIEKTLASNSGKAYVNPSTNIIAWQDQKQAAEQTLAWMKRLDRPLPQANIRLNYYELRESDLNDVGVDFLAWKNGPGVNLLNVGYNAGRIAVDEILYNMMEQMPFAMANNWALGGFFTAPQFDMSFLRCLQQNGQASRSADANVTAVSTPIRSQSEYMNLLLEQAEHPDVSKYIYTVNMEPEYQNLQKNTLGRSFIGKSYIEDEYGNKIADPPLLNAKIINPFICYAAEDSERDADGFIPDTPEYYGNMKNIRDSGGVLFQYELCFKDVVERGNMGSELSNSALFSGAVTIGFNEEKVLSVYEKENNVEQVIGVPVLCRLPILKYLTGTTTHIRERTYIIVTAEAIPIHPDMKGKLGNESINSRIERRTDTFKKNAGKLENEVEK